MGISGIPEAFSRYIVSWQLAGAMILCSQILSYRARRMALLVFRDVEQAINTQLGVPAYVRQEGFWQESWVA